MKEELGEERGIGRVGGKRKKGELVGVEREGEK